MSPPPIEPATTPPPPPAPHGWQDGDCKCHKLDAECWSWEYLAPAEGGEAPLTYVAGGPVEPGPGWRSNGFKRRLPEALLSRRQPLSKSQQLTESEWQQWGWAFCGKGDPMQIMHVSHGCAPARFRGVRLL